jgi:hypothetical protein
MATANLTPSSGAKATHTATHKTRLDTATQADHREQQQETGNSGNKTVDGHDDE